MARGTDAARRHADLARIGLGIGAELGDRLGWNRWFDHHDLGKADDARDSRDVADEIEIELFVERRIDRVCRSDQEERVAIRGRTHDRLGADIGTCPCRKPYPAWQSIENRTMIACNEGSLQVHWLDGCGSDPVAGNA